MGLPHRHVDLRATAAASNEKLFQALEKKVAGAIRSAVSNCSHVAQSVLAKAMSTDAMLVERRQKKEVLEARAKRSTKSSPRPNMPNSGSRIPSTPVTSCA